MIQGKGKITKVAGCAHIDEFLAVCRKLPDNDDYEFVIANNTRNRNLPFLSYLFSVVLKYISDSLPSHPPTMALYKFFEAKFAPVHASIINGERFEYRDLKSEKASDVNNIIEMVVEYALNTWGIEIPRKEELRDPAFREFYSQAYLNQEVDWSSFISSRLKTKDERRKEKTQRV